VAAALAGVLASSGAAGVARPPGRRAVSLASDSLITGRFQATDGSRLVIFRAALGPAFLHYPSGRLGILHPLGGDRHGAGPGAMGRAPIEVEIEIIREGGAVVGAAYRSGGAETRFAHLPPFRRIDSRVTHGEAGLAVSATLPAGAGPFPAMVIHHGGGPGVRADVQLWADHFADHGFAAVTYDKRGSGETTGPAWETFADLAADAAAIIGWTKGQSWATPSCVATWAYSQSGWVVPLAVAREPVAFIIAVSVPALSPAGRAAASVRPRLLADGLTAAEADAASAFVELVNGFGRGRVPWATYGRALEAARGTSWIERIEKPTGESAPASPFYHGEFGRFLDPLPYWTRIDVPILAVYGGLDTTVPAPANAPLLATALAANRRAMVVVLPGANHQLLRAVTGGDAELISLNTYASGYFQLIEDFLANRRSEGC
jgi:alpha-beta hydrolase superfamily lysophospholipase